MKKAISLLAITCVTAYWAAIGCTASVDPEPPSDEATAVVSSELAAADGGWVDTCKGYPNYGECNNKACKAKNGKDSFCVWGGGTGCECNDPLVATPVGDEP